MNKLQAEGVVKRYANHLALDNVNLSIPESQVFGLLGPNGAGKTTFIRIINHITMPDSGQILFNGRKLKANDIQCIGYLPEERGLYKKMKVGEQALYLARLKGLSRQDALKKLKYWFNKFEITAWWDKKVEELSKGMQQKIQFIVTVLHQPELLIFDEPFSGFDPINANLLKREILELKKQGSTIIFSTHNMSSVEELCDEICLINQSKTILKGKVSEVKQQYKSNKVELLFQGNADKMQELLPPQFSVDSLSSIDGVEKAVINCDGDTDSNILLKSVLDSVRVKGFTEILPTMDEVFIKAVQHSNLNR